METLQQQNDQLWRLVERQRLIIFQLRHQLERQQEPTEPAPRRHSRNLLDDSAALKIKTAPADDVANVAQSSNRVSPNSLKRRPSVAFIQSFQRKTNNGSSVSLSNKAIQASPPTQIQIAHLRTSLHLLTLNVSGVTVGTHSAKSGKEKLLFVISLHMREKENSSTSNILWHIVKLYSQISALETQGKSAQRTYASSAALDKLPDKSHFTVNALGPPSSPEHYELLDSRRHPIDHFLSQILSLVVDSPFGPFTQQLIHFLCTDLCNPAHYLSHSLYENSPACDYDATNVRNGASLDAKLLPQRTSQHDGDTVRQPSHTSSVSHTMAGLFGHDGGISRLLKKATPQGGSARKNLSIIMESIDRKPAPQVFGVSLEKSMADSRVRNDLDLPAVVYRCIEYLEQQNAQTEEGIYRLSGSSMVIRKLKDRFEAEGDVDLIKDAEAASEYLDVHAVAGLLKLYFRELPSSILTPEYHSDFLTLQEVENIDDRVAELRRLLNMLPYSNYTVLRALIAHLATIVEHSDVNKMNIRNLGIVFAPTLGIPAGIFAFMLSEGKEAFGISTLTESSDESITHPDSGVSILATDDPDICESPAYARSSEKTTQEALRISSSLLPNSIKSIGSNDDIADLMGEYASSQRDSKDSQVMGRRDDVRDELEDRNNDSADAEEDVQNPENSQHKTAEAECEFAMQGQRTSMGFLSYYASSEAPPVKGYAAESKMIYGAVPTPATTPPSSQAHTPTASPSAMQLLPIPSPRTSSAAILRSPNLRQEAEMAAISPKSEHLLRLNDEGDKQHLRANGESVGTRRHSMFMEGIELVPICDTPVMSNRTLAELGVDRHVQGPPKSNSAGLSPQMLLSAEANLHALLRMKKERLSRELANLSPAQITHLQVLLNERTQRAS